MAEKIHDMLEALYILESATTQAERARSCCNLVIESLESEINAMQMRGALPDILLSLHLISEIYFDVEKETNTAFNQLFEITKQLRKAHEQNEEGDNNE